jgi:hypothetical protein
MPTPARGPQKPPLEKGAAVSFLRRRIRAIARSRALRLGDRATRERAKQHRTLRFSPSTLRRPPRPKGASRPLQPCSALLCMSTAHRVVVSALPVRVRIWSLQPGAERTWASVGSHGTSPASFDVGCSASAVSATMDTVPLRETPRQWDTVPLRTTMPLRDTMPLWDTVPLRDICAAVGYRAAAGLRCRCRG